MAKHKLSQEVAAVIRKLWREGMSYRDLAAKYDVGITSIRMIVKGKSYFDPCYQPPTKSELKSRNYEGGKTSKPTGRFNEGEIFTILKLWHSGQYPLLEIAKLFNCNRSTVANVIYGFAYQEVGNEIREELGVTAIHRREE